MATAPRRLLLLSGGLDSALAWEHCGFPQAIHFLSGDASMLELAAAYRLAADRPFLLSEHFEWLVHYTTAGGYVPYRNLLFLLEASLRVAPGGTLLIAQVKGEWQTDKNRDFYRRAEALIAELGRRKVSIEAPIAHLSKTQAVAAYLKRGGDPAWLLKTYSCLRDVQGHCGACSSCVNRYVALKANGIEPQMPKPAPWAIAENAFEQVETFRVRNIPMYVEAGLVKLKGLLR